MKVICLTGKMAAGKNYIADKLASEGAAVTDLDKTVHEAITILESRIIEEFSAPAQAAGISLKNKDGLLNRRALGRLVFSDSKLLARQEKLVYPKVIELTKDFIDENRDRDVILNATVLYKTPELLKLCDLIYFVDAPFFKRLWRAKRRDGMPLIQILKRFKSQKGLLKKYRDSQIPIVIIKN